MRAAAAACVALLGLAAAGPGRADSFTSSASSAGSASVASLSDSVSGSSKSSTGAARVAEGDYRVVEVAALAGRPGLLRLQLQASAQAGSEGELWLTLRAQALAQRGLVAGDVVHASQRPYGVAFAHTAPPQTFLLLLAGDWARELDSQAVVR